MLKKGNESLQMFVHYCLNCKLLRTASFVSVLVQLAFSLCKLVLFLTKFKRGNNTNWYNTDYLEVTKRDIINTLSLESLISGL